MAKNILWILTLALVAACSSPTTSAGKTPVDAGGADGAVAEVADSTADAGADDAALAVDATADVAPDATDAASEVADATAVVDAVSAVDATDVADVGPDAGADTVAAADTVAVADAADVADATTETGDCPERAKIIYVVSQENKLFSFSPDTLQLKLVGALNCPNAIGTPFSMGVDRNATAWVLYTDGSIFQVSTLDAACTGTAFVAGQSKFDEFGMAFTADAPGAVTEKLYVVGGGKNGFQAGPNKLATIDVQSFALTVINMLTPVASGPDLTGNGNGELWGFFANTQPASVRQIDPATAQTGKAFLLPDAEFGSIGSWAFASWGGDFYLFSRSGKQTSTAVYKLDGVTGQVTKVVAALGFTITGAGVSSCAPTKAP